MFKILSANTISLLEEEVHKYDVQVLGSLTISNGHLYLAILGELKKPKVVQEIPKVTKAAPKRKPRASPKAKPKS